MKISINIEEIKKNEGIMFLQLLGSLNKKEESIIDKQGFRFKSNTSKSILPFNLIKSVTFLKSIKNTETHVLLFINENTKWNENIRKKHPIRFKLGILKQYRAYVDKLGVISSSEDVDQIIDMLRYLKYKVEVYTEEVESVKK